jgi:hypothetical protein
MSPLYVDVPFGWRSSHLDADIPFASWSPLLDGGFPLDGDVSFTWSNVHLVPVACIYILFWDFMTNKIVFSLLDHPKIF